MSLANKTPTTNSLQSNISSLSNKWKKVETNINNLKAANMINQVRKELNDIPRICSQIEVQLKADDPDKERLNAQYMELLGIINSKKDEYMRLVNSAESTPQPTMSGPSSSGIGSQLNQTLIDESAEISVIESQTQGIVEDMAELNKTTHQVAEVIEESHEVVMKVETTIEDAHQEMQEGNQQLDQAKEYQKGSSKCLCYILIIILIIIAIIAATQLLKKK